MPTMTIAEIEALMDKIFAGWRLFSSIVALGDNDITLEMPFRKELLRAGGTISDPAMMMLADTAAYFVTLAHAGPVASAATANLDIAFLRRPRHRQRATSRGSWRSSRPTAMRGRGARRPSPRRRRPTGRPSSTACSGT